MQFVIRDINTNVRVFVFVLKILFCGPLFYFIFGLLNIFEKNQVGIMLIHSYGVERDGVLRCIYYFTWLQRTFTSCLCVCLCVCIGSGEKDQQWPMGWRARQVTLMKAALEHCKMAVMSRRGRFYTKGKQLIFPHEKLWRDEAIH